MNKFNKGDIVKVVNYSEYDNGKQGIIQECWYERGIGLTYIIKYENGNGGQFPENNLELIPKK